MTFYASVAIRTMLPTNEIPMKFPLLAISSETSLSKSILCFVVFFLGLPTLTPFQMITYQQHPSCTLRKSPRLQSFLVLQFQRSYSKTLNPSWYLLASVKSCW